MTTVERDKERRFIIAQGFLEGKQVLFVNIDASNDKQQQFFQTIIKVLELYENIRHWKIAGDFRELWKHQKIDQE